MLPHFLCDQSEKAFEEAEVHSLYVCEGSTLLDEGQQIMNAGIRRRVGAVCGVGVTEVNGLDINSTCYNILTFRIHCLPKIERNSKDALRLLIDHAGFAGARALDDAHVVGVCRLTIHAVDIVMKESMSCANVFQGPGDPCS